VAKRLVDRVRKLTNIPVIEYLFNEESTPLPDLGGIQSTLEKRTRHRRALMRMLFDNNETDRMLICLDPAALDLMQDFYSDRSTTRILEIDCEFTDEYLIGHGKRVGLAGEMTAKETLDRLLPTIRYDVRFESDRIRDANFPHHYRIRECASVLERTGELLELANEAPGQLQDAYEKDDRFAKGQLALFAPLVHMMHDDPDAALRMLDEQRGHAHGAFDTTQLWLLYRTVDANMYAGHVDDAVRYLKRELPRLQRSSLFRTKFVRLGAYFLHGKCSIGAAARYPDLLLEAARSARALERMGRTDADCYALVLRAGIAARSGERARAAELCRRAVLACGAAHIGHYAWLAARNLARVSDAAHEQSAGREAEANMLAQGIENPERWSATFAPGFSAPEES
jgi:hypothetical protein